MKDFLKILFDAFIKIMPFVPEKWHANKWFWLYWMCVGSLVIGIFMYFFM